MAMTNIYLFKSTILTDSPVEVWVYESPQSNISTLLSLHHQCVEKSEGKMSHGYNMYQRKRKIKAIL